MQSGRTNTVIFFLEGRKEPRTALLSVFILALEEVVTESADSTDQERESLSPLRER